MSKLIKKIICFIKRLFGKCECNCSCCSKEKDVIIKRKSGEIILSPRIYKELIDKGYTLSVTKIKDTVATISVYQNTGGQAIYKGALRKMFNVKAFKDGNRANFSESNLIYNEERKQ